MWKCPKCGEEVEGDFEVCWNCQTIKPREVGSQKLETMEEANETPKRREEECEVTYHFRTLLGYGKVTSGIGWATMIIGIVAVFVSIAQMVNSGVRGIEIMIVGVICIISGFYMVVNGQVISCFVSVERNTRAIYEILKQK